MKKTLIISVFISLAICLASASAIMAEMPTTDPVALWNYITKISPYSKWSYWSDHQGMQLSRAPHGTLHRVYVNDRALNSSGPPLQNGSIEVMENYQGESEELHNITVMYKAHGYNPPDGDWYWAKYTPEGKVVIHGKPRSCIGCHGTRAKNDFVVVHEFK